MIKELIHDPIFLAGKSAPACKSDLPIAKDLLDTLTAYRETCVGMAANMIGERKRIIAFADETASGQGYTVMLNPEIIGKSGAYEAEEGCLSLLGASRPCRRFRTIEVRFQNEKMQVKTKVFSGFTAQIIQHEIDHCDGILI